ncbi:MAG: alpha/beta hydrolase [Actinomycetota bacterium]
MRLRIQDALSREAAATTPALFETFVRDVTPFHFADPLDPRIGTYLDETSGTIFRPDAHIHSAGMAQIAVEDRLGEIGAPLLVIAGRHDRSSTVAAARAIVKGAPNGEYALFDQSGHLPFVEEPELFRATLVGFLDRHP